MFQKIYLSDIFKAHSNRIKILKRGGMERAKVRGQKDLAILMLLREALLRGSEAAVLTWGDIEEAVDGSGRLLIRKSKTDQEGAGDVQYLSKGTIQALQKIKPANCSPDDKVLNLSERQICRHLKAVTNVAGLGEGSTGHSGRIGMAQDWVAVGCEISALMQAGRWKTNQMPACYTRA